MLAVSTADPSIYDSSARARSAEDIRSMSARGSPLASQAILQIPTRDGRGSIPASSTILTKVEPAQSRRGLGLRRWRERRSVFSA